MQISAGTCLECNENLHPSVFEYSTQNFGIPLCRRHQHWLKHEVPNATTEALDLYFALKQRGVPAELEKHDGYKSIDIAVVEARVNIEVDGGHHQFDHDQALSDLKRTYYSFLKGYLTLRIPNVLVRSHLNETADMLVDILLENRDKHY